MIEVNNVHYTAGGSPILQSVSLSAMPGELVALLGPNGAGKSTLLRLLCGSIRPNGGSIVYDGKNLQQYSAAVLACRRAVLTQHFAVTLPFTCEEVVLMGRYPHFRHSPAALDRKIVDACMEEMQVTAFRTRLFSTLSGGEQQRVQLARILAQLQDDQGYHNKLLLLDEPTASMDYLQQQLCLRKAKEVARKGGCVLVILHDLNLAAQFADRIVLLQQGRVVAQGPPAHILQPGTIAGVYGVEVDILRNEQYHFPVIVPAMYKNTSPILHS
jgi:iron complex transport system ATP-binding protein